MVFIPKISGILGLLAITGGVLTTDRKLQDKLYILGGILLEIYSISLGDYIFMTLQAIFTVAAVYDYLQLHARR